MRALTKVILLLMILCLVGCACEPKIEYRYKDVLITPPDSFMVKCAIEPPPVMEVYLLASTEEQEKLLFDMNIQQIKNIALCNERIEKLAAWKKEQKELYEKKQQGSK